LDWPYRSGAMSMSRTRDAGLNPLVPFSNAIVFLLITFKLLFSDP
jgi:hypothetical protein